MLLIPFKKSDRGALQPRVAKMSMTKTNPSKQMGKKKKLSVQHTSDKLNKNEKFKIGVQEFFVLTWLSVLP